jgi:hypothetical protein
VQVPVSDRCCCEGIPPLSQVGLCRPLEVRHSDSPLRRCLARPQRDAAPRGRIPHPVEDKGELGPLGILGIRVGASNGARGSELAEGTLERASVADKPPRVLDAVARQRRTVVTAGKDTHVQELRVEREGEHTRP